jgi:hypothetical protein
VDKVLEEAMPLDEPRRQEALIWFAFVGLAPGNPTLAAELDRAYADIIDRLARRVGGRRRAEVLFAAVDGITVQALARPGVMTPARQRAALRAILAS